MTSPDPRHLINLSAGAVADLVRPQYLTLSSQPDPCGTTTLLRFARRPFSQRLAAIVMMAAWVAFAVQGMFVAASEAATGDSSHYYLGFVFGHSHGEGHSHVVTHRHAGGIVHQHAIDDDDDALAEHVKGPGWDMAVVVCVLPSRDISTVFVA